MTVLQAQGSIGDTHPGKRCANCPFPERPIVPGRGPLDSPIAFMAESPGREEHLMGRILVGPSGQLLHAAIERAGLPEPYLCNASFCTPPDDPEAKKAAVAACREERLADLRKVNPEIIVTLGALAAESIFGPGSVEGITRRLGEMRMWEGRRVLLNVHPAYVLRQGDSYFDFQEVLNLTRKILDGRAPVSMDVPYKEAYTGAESIALLNELQREVESGEKLALDLETSGFNPYALQLLRNSHGELITRKDRIILLCLATRERSYIFHEEAFNESFEEIKGFLEQKGLYLIMHVSAFDASFLRARGIKIRAYHDTALKHYSTDERKYTHGLKELSRIRLGSEDWEKDIKKYLPSPKKSSYELIPKKPLAKYASYDGVRTVQLDDEIEPQLIEADRKLLSRMLMPAQEMFIELRHRGAKIDTARLLQLDENMGRRLREIEQEMCRITGDVLFTPTPLKCAHYIYDILRLQPIDAKTSTRRLKIGAAAKGVGERSTQADALLDLPQVPFVKLLLEYRELQHDRSHYTLGMLEFLDENDRIHPQIDITGTITGRLASNNPSVLNIKRPPELDVVTKEVFKDWDEVLDKNWKNHPRYTEAVKEAEKRIYEYKDIRSIFIPDEGYTLFEADQSQFELRNYAVIAGIPQMLELFRKEEDIHDFTDKLMGLNDRVRAKAVNFGLVYGLTLNSLATRLGIFPEAYDSELEYKKAMAQAQYYYGLLNAKLPGIKEFENRVIETVKAFGELETVFGRRRRFPIITDNNLYKIKNEALNYETSSTSTDINLYGAMGLYPKEQELGINLFWTIHDSVFGQVRTDMLKDSLNFIGKFLANTPKRELGGRFAECKYQVEIKVGANGGLMRKWGRFTSDD